MNDYTYRYFNYEASRLSRYEQNTYRSVNYVYEALLLAYMAWTRAQGSNRDNLWDNYCDIRDGVPAGTNYKIRFTYDQPIATRYT